MNVVLEYLYRDAGNYKNWQEVIFTNKAKIPLSKLNEDIKSRLIDGLYFSAEALQLPTAYFDNVDAELDHNWHEYSECRLTDAPETDLPKRDISDFLSALISACR